MCLRQREGVGLAGVRTWEQCISCMHTIVLNLLGSNFITKPLCKKPPSRATGSSLVSENKFHTKMQLMYFRSLRVVLTCVTSLRTESSWVRKLHWVIPCIWYSIVQFGVKHIVIIWARRRLNFNFYNGGSCKKHIPEHILNAFLSQKHSRILEINVFRSSVKHTIFKMQCFLPKNIVFKIPKFTSLKWIYVSGAPRW